MCNFFLQTFFVQEWVMVDGVVSGSKMCNCRVVLKVFNICFIGLVFLIRKDHNCRAGSEATDRATWGGNLS